MFGIVIASVSICLFAIPSTLDGTPAQSTLYVSSVHKHQPVDTVETARRALADLGIPFTAEAFATTCGSGQLEHAFLFFTGGMDPNAIDQKQQSCLIAATHEGRTSLVDRLLQSGAEIKIRDRFGASPLMHASSQGYTDLVDRLLAAGADVAAVDDFYDWTPLVFAAYDGHNEVVAALLDAGADPDHVSSKDNYTALLLATHKGRLETVMLLVQSGADLGLKNRQGQTAFDIAEQYRFKRLARFLKQSMR